MKPIAIVDSETFRDYYLFAVRHLETGDVEFFETYPGKPFPVSAVREVLKNHRLVSFNDNGYDLPVLALALAGRPCEVMKAASDTIILQNIRGFQVLNQYGVRAPKVDHVDLIEIAPGKNSLKIYAGRLHSHTLQDLPFDPAASIDAEGRAVLREYCANDLDNTRDLYEALRPQIELREVLSKQYGQDLLSRGDAQIAEHVISAEVDKIHPYQAPKPEVYDGQTFYYKPPSIIGFATPPLQALLATIRSTPLTVVNGKIKLPKELDAAIRIGAGEYRLGIGGLHSSEQSVTHLAKHGWRIVDRDVTSYYPSIILNCGLYPKHLGPAFLTVYRDIVDRRVAAKHAGDKVTDASLKIVINSSFGKFGNRWSNLYSPDLLIQVTLTGQLALLMLIEHLEIHGVDVLSANTDGIVIRYRTTQDEQVENLIAGWELVTGFQTEATHYAAIYSRDVNNYLAVRREGKVKAKGAFAPGGLGKNPQNEICTEAVIAYLQNGTPLVQTIEPCRDIRKFLSLRKVTGGAVDQLGLDVGKTVRWYYSTDIDGPITYKVNGYTVPRTDGARVLPVLPASFPTDVDLRWYVEEAQSILESIGAVKVQGDMLHAA